MGIDVTTITAVSAWALATGTLLILYWQTRQNQQLNSANAVMELRERFDSTRMRRARRHLSTRLLEHRYEDITSVEVATFFELVGTLTRRRVLEAELVWEAFGTWISSYYWAIRNPVDMIGKVREDLKDPLVFHEYEWLYNRILSIDRHMGSAPVTDPQVLQTESHTMLRRESHLDLEET